MRKANTDEEEWYAYLQSMSWTDADRALMANPGDPILMDAVQKERDAIIDKRRELIKDEINPDPTSDAIIFAYEHEKGKCPICGNDFCSHILTDKIPYYQFAYEHERENKLKQEYARSSVYPWQCQPDFSICL